MLANDRESIDTLNQVNRHDRVCIQGNIIANPSPREHIAVDSIQVLESWSQPEGFTPYERQVDIPTADRDRTNFIGSDFA